MGIKRNRIPFPFLHSSQGIRSKCVIWVNTPFNVQCVLTLEMALTILQKIPSHNLHTRIRMPTQSSKFIKSCEYIWNLLDLVMAVHFIKKIYKKKEEKTNLTTSCLSYVKQQQQKHNNNNQFNIIQIITLKLIFFCHPLNAWKL